MLRYRVCRRHCEVCRDLASWLLSQLLTAKQNYIKTKATNPPHSDLQLTTPNSRALSAAGRRSEGELTRLLPGSAHGALRKVPAIGCLGAFTPGNLQGHRAGPCLLGGWSSAFNPQGLDLGKASPRAPHSHCFSTGCSEGKKCWKVCTSFLFSKQN